MIKLVQIKMTEKISKTVKIKLFGLTVVKTLFSIITMPFCFILAILEIILYAISLGKIDFDLNKKLSSFCIKVLKKILHLEIDLLLSKKEHQY
jgi:hypothetical protein